jgi:Zn-finger nucleic acid-binding protein
MSGREPEMPGLVKCAQCGKEVNAKCVFCPFCGGRLGDEKISGKPLCPRCGTPLELRRRDDGIEIDYCPSCNGLWLDRGEFALLTAESTVYREEKLSEEYSRPMLPDTIQYIPCVRCGKLMSAEDTASGSTVESLKRSGISYSMADLRNCNSRR